MCVCVLVLLCRTPFSKDQNHVHGQQVKHFEDKHSHIMSSAKRLLKQMAQMKKEHTQVAKNAAERVKKLRKQKDDL